MVGCGAVFPNYTDELPFFIASVFALLREAGLRCRRPSPTVVMPS